MTTQSTLRERDYTGTSENPPVMVTVLPAGAIMGARAIAYLSARTARTALPAEWANRADVILVLADPVDEETRGWMERVAAQAQPQPLPAETLAASGTPEAGSPVSGTPATGTPETGAPRAARLEDRERDVLRLLADGIGTPEIANRLSYSERTVKNIIHQLLTRMQLHNRTHAVAFALRNGLL